MKTRHTSQMANAPSTAISANAEMLLSRSSGWLAAAMDAWAGDEQEKVTALAPLAVELAMKAVLLNTNPALLVPLDRQHEASLINLTTEVRLTDPKLRTIGLAEAIRRAIAVARTEPSVKKDRRDRLVACRNGSVHIGAINAETGRHVLTDCISMLAWALHVLAQPEGPFFGSNLGDCRALLQQVRSEAEQVALARISKHRRFYETFVAGLTGETAAAVIENLEDGVLTAHIPMEEGAPDIIGARVACPACNRSGAIYGLIDVDGDADAEWEDGEVVLYGRWVVTLAPEMFVCDVCRLRMWGAQDLEIAGLPHEPYEPDGKDLGDFDPADYTDGLSPDDY